MFLANEAYFLLKSLGWNDLRPTYDSKQLVATAQQVDPAWLENVAATFKKFRGWEWCTSNIIIDRVYGLDYIIDIGGTSERLGLCLATDPALIEGKIEKAHTLSPLWQSIGVTKVVVLLTVYPVKEGATFYDDDKSKNNMLGVILNAVESDREVISAEVHLEFM
jgi:hypothetical protein